jgi:hypothetical protein
MRYGFCTFQVQQFSRLLAEIMRENQNRCFFCLFLKNDLRYPLGRVSGVHVYGVRGNRMCCERRMFHFNLDSL